MEAVPVAASEGRKLRRRNSQKLWSPAPPPDAICPDLVRWCGMLQLDATSPNSGQWSGTYDDGHPRMFFFSSNLPPPIHFFLLCFSSLISNQFSVNFLISLFFHRPFNGVSLVELVLSPN